MKATVLLLLCSAIVGQLALARHSAVTDWEEYKRQHGKIYASPEEDARRFSLFLAAKDKIQKHNSMGASYKLGLNHLADKTPEEFSRLNGFRPRNKTLGESKHVEAMEFLEKLLADSPDIPVEVDWRKAGRVSPVKDQGDCGSCWAFSAVGVLEGQERSRLDSETIVSLSAQDLLDCSQQNTGCKGGNPAIAMEDIHRLGGIETDEDYRYVARQEYCRFKKAKSFITDDGSYDFEEKGEDVLMKLVAKFGPVSVIVSAEGWQLYDSGVFDSEACLDDLDHAVLLVGYGRDPESGDYWLVKNSWSENWGEDGYIRIARGKRRCGFGVASYIPKWNDKL